MGVRMLKLTSALGAICKLLKSMSSVKVENSVRLLGPHRELLEKTVHLDSQRRLHMTAEAKVAEASLNVQKMREGQTTDDPSLEARKADVAKAEENFKEKQRIFKEIEQRDESILKEEEKEKEKAMAMVSQAMEALTAATQAQRKAAVALTEAGEYLDKARMTDYAAKVAAKMAQTMS